MIAPKVQLIEIDRIDESESNPRLAECERQDELDALARDMKAHGQMQPIGVKEDGRRFRVVFGSRRLKAARIAGMMFIAAMVLPPETDEVAVAAAENIHRRAMNPYEELLAVEMIAMRHFHHLAGHEQHRAIGEAMGKSASWVRDRIFLKRLCPIAREKLTYGLLPVSHARELAKVADHDRQERIMGYGPLSLEALRDECNAVGLPLATVPWELDAKGVARKQPCTSCPNYSPNAQHLGLFEHDDADVAPKGEQCLDQRCYTAKYAAAQKVVEEVRDGGNPSGAPRWLKSEALARAAEPKRQAATPKAPTKEEAEAVRKRQAERSAELERAFKDAAAFDKAFDREIAQQPGLGVLLVLLDTCKPAWMESKPGRKHRKMLSDIGARQRPTMELLDEIAGEGQEWTPSASLRALVRHAPSAEAREAIHRAFCVDFAGLGDHPGAPKPESGRKGGQR